MKRREFITFLGGAVATWPLVTRAQQSMPVIGFLRSTSRASSEHLVTAFLRGLKETGYSEGQNVIIEYRWADNQADRLPALAGDLVNRQVAVIVANSTSAFAVNAATTTIPMVILTGSDPVKAGLVANLNHPGGNVTAVVFFSDDLGTKRLELLHQFVPKAATIGALVNPNHPGTEDERRNFQAAARVIGLQLIVLDVRSIRDIETAFATFVQRGARALLVGSGAFLFSNRERLVALAARHALPTSFAQGSLSRLAA